MAESPPCYIYIVPYQVGRFLYFTLYIAVVDIKISNCLYIMIKLLLFSGCYLKVTLHLTMYSVQILSVKTHQEAMMMVMTCHLNKMMESCSLWIRYFHAFKGIIYHK